MPSKYDFEAQAVHVYPFIPGGYNPDIASAEFDCEWPQVDISSQGGPESAEFRNEWKSVALTQVHLVSPLSSEYDYEAKHVLAAMGGISVDAYTRGYEIMGDVNTLTQIEIRSAEFDYELRPMALQYGQPDNAEFAFEASAASFTQQQVLGVINAEFDWEGYSLSLFDTSFDRGFEVASVAITQLGVLQTNSAEFDSEVVSIDLTQSNTPQGVSRAEFGREIQSVTIGSGDFDIFEHEHGWEARSVKLRNFRRHPRTATQRIKYVRV